MFTIVIWLLGFFLIIAALQVLVDVVRYIVVGVADAVADARRERWERLHPPPTEAELKRQQEEAMARYNAGIQEQIEAWKKSRESAKDAPQSYRQSP